MDYQLTYVTTDPLRWGAGTGAPHLPATADDIIATLEERVWTLENTPPDANSVANITQSGATITFWLSDGTTTFSAELPGTEIRFLEDGWTPDTGIFKNDLFVFERTGLYVSLQDHVTAAEFDPAAANESGSLYRLLMDPFSGSAPKAIEESTDSIYFPELLDANKYLVWSGMDDLTVSIPADDDVAFAIGAELHFRQAGLGSVMISGDTDVTINPSRPGFGTATPWQGANCTVKKVAANEWDYIGPGTEATA